MYLIQTPVCGPGGIYYTDIHNLENFKDYGNMIGIIKIPSDTPIVKIETSQSVKYKSPRIEIIDIMTYMEFIYNKDIYQEEKMKCKDPVLKLRMTKEQTPEICLEAVKQHGWALKFVKEQTPEICIEAVKQNGYALEYVKEQTPEICLEAVKQYGWTLQFVKEQTPEICLEAVKKRWICFTICQRSDTRDLSRCY